MRCRKGEKEICVSEKAYRVVYHAQGYLPVEGSVRSQPRDSASTEMPETTLEEMPATQLRAVAKEKGIKGTSSLNREELLEVLKGVNGND